MGVVTAAVKHGRTVAVDLACQLRCQPRLADALGPQHRHEAASPVDGVRPGVPEPRQIGLAADEGGTHLHERARSAPGTDTGAGESTSSDGSSARTAASSRRRSGPGSMPNSSVSRRRARWYASRASR